MFTKILELIIFLELAVWWVNYQPIPTWIVFFLASSNKIISLVIVATMPHAWITLEISKQICCLTSICMTMLRRYMIKSVTRPSSSIHTHLSLLICKWWQMPSKQVLQGWRKNLKLWSQTTKYRLGLLSF